MTVKLDDLRPGMYIAVRSYNLPPEPECELPSRPRVALPPMPIPAMPFRVVSVNLPHVALEPVPLSRGETRAQKTIICTDASLLNFIQLSPAYIRNIQRRAKKPNRIDKYKLYLRGGIGA